MYLLDTNIVGELRKGNRADPGVATFFSQLNAEVVYLPVQTVGELRRGLENIRRRGDALQAETLQTWLETVLSEYLDRILDFDLECAQVWGKLMSSNPHHEVDKQIAAIALVYDMTVVTRNTDDFAGCRVRTLNPFLR